MTGAMIAQLLLLYGPDLVNLLAQKWNQEMTPDEVQAACSVSRKSIADLNKEARERLISLGLLPPDPVPAPSA